MIEFLSDIDTQIFLWVNSLHHGAFDFFMMLISHKYVWVPLYAVLILLIIRRFGWKTGSVVLLASVVAVVFSDQVCASLIRPTVERMRPANPDNPLAQMVHIVEGYRGGSFGFPSCHAANTFALAFVLSAVFCWRLPVSLTLYVWAILNCWSRVYLGVHYPGDLLVGAIVGTLSGLLVYLVLITFVKKVFKTDFKSFVDKSISIRRPISQFSMPDILLPALVVTIIVLALMCISLDSYYSLPSII